MKLQQAKQRFADIVPASTGREPKKEIQHGI